MNQASILYKNVVTKVWKKEKNFFEFFVTFLLQILIKYEMEGNGENERTKFERYIKKCPDFGKNNKGTSEWLAELLGGNIYEKSKRKE